MITTTIRNPAYLKKILPRESSIDEQLYEDIIRLIAELGVLQFNTLEIFTVNAVG